MVIDTGQSGNLFSPHYFNMNAIHIKGELLQISQDLTELEKAANNQVIQIKPKSPEGLGTSKSKGASE